MRELVVMQTAGKFGLLEMGGNVLVWHLLRSSLEKVILLRTGQWEILLLFERC